jgi:endonuclease-3
MEKDAKHFAQIRSLLRACYPQPQTELHFKTPHQLLVATILSAQCTDARVNQVTQELFRKYPSVQDFAAASLPELEQDVRSTGFYKHKAKNIQSASHLIVERFGGEVPQTMEELTTLPGVARKTANVVLAEAFGRQEGIAVDTHVMRLSRLLGLSSEKTPEKIEADLMAQVPRAEWGTFSNLLILHGRRVCAARKPRCAECCLRKICPSAPPADK